MDITTHTSVCCVRQSIVHEHEASLSTELLTMAVARPENTSVHSVFLSAETYAIGAQMKDTIECWKWTLSLSYVIITSALSLSVGICWVPTGNISRYVCMPYAKINNGPPKCEGARVWATTIKTDITRVGITHKNVDTSIRFPLLMPVLILALDTVQHVIHGSQLSTLTYLHPISHLDPCHTCSMHT